MLRSRGHTSLSTTATKPTKHPRHITKALLAQGLFHYIVVEPELLVRYVYGCDNLVTIFTIELLSSIKPVHIQNKLSCACCCKMFFDPVKKS